MLVALTDPIEPAGEAILRAAGHETALPRGGDAAALRALCAAADAVIVRRKLPDDFAEASLLLLAAVRHGVGVDRMPGERCTTRGVVVRSEERRIGKVC